MHKPFVLSLFVILLSLVHFEPTTANFPTECRIYSDLYKEYLYAKFKFLGLGKRRMIYLWQDNRLGFKSLLRRPPTTQFSSEDASGVWTLEPVSGRPNTFYITNMKYPGEYMRGTDSFQEFIFKKNRGVFVEKINNQFDDESFMWTLYRVPNTHLYHIWNVKFNLPLYTREYYSSRRDHNDNVKSERVLIVSMWNDKPYSEQFDWLLRCRDNVLPNLVNSNFGDVVN